MPTLLNKLNTKLIALAVSFSILGIVALMAGFFVAGDIAANAYATDSTDVSTLADDGNYITLSVADAALDLIPSADSAATSTKISVNVQASGTNSVSVYANMDSSAASNNLYLDGDSSDTTCVISAVDDTITLDALPANTWGYSVDGINYFPMPTASSSPAYIGVASIDSANTGSVSLYYGASVDTSLPAGKYSNTVKYSAVANAGTTPDITSYTLTADGATTDWSYVKI